MEIDVHETDGSMYRILSSVVVPRPIAWVSSRSPDGVDNLAPFSFYTVVSIDPPMIAFAPTDRDGGLKDTPSNVLASEEFVVNLVTMDLAEAMNETSATLEPSQSEFDHAGVERAPSVTVEPPRVADSQVSFECTCDDVIDLPNSLLVLGAVEYVHVDDRLLSERKIDVRNVDALGRLAGSYYATTRERFTLQRPP